VFALHFARRRATVDVMSDGAEYTCPHCGETVVVDAVAVDQTWSCPACGGEFSLSTHVTEPKPEPEPDRADELDGLRIHQITAQRRADIRVRSYLFTAAIGCVAAAAQCVFWVWRAGGWTRSRVAFVLAAVAFLCGAGWLARKVAAISRELAKPLLDEPPSPPDFSQLQDGSQMARDLDQF
jgi:predicted RNA-binding Zn-ribbon protein involved in translation (DUF1610 family)